MTYSGTIAGAMEGTILGMPVDRAVAGLWPRSGATQSALGLRRDARADRYAQAARRRHSAGHADQREFPGLSAGCRSRASRSPCRAGATRELLKIDARHDGRGNPYYWIAFQRGAFTPGKGTDLEALAANKISLTPLRLDLTDEDAVTRYAQAFAEKKPEPKRVRSR